jgi:hypothetical protein
MGQPELKVFYFGELKKHIGMAHGSCFESH